MLSQDQLLVAASAYAVGMRDGSPVTAINAAITVLHEEDLSLSYKEVLSIICAFSAMYKVMKKEGPNV